MTLFTGQYKLTNKMLYEAKIVRFTLHDSKASYILKDRYEIYSNFDKLSYFDIPIEFFQEKNALIELRTFNNPYTDAPKSDCAINATMSKDTDKVYEIECIVNGPMFRHYVFGSNEWAPMTFQEEMIEKERKRKNMEGSSETIETKSEMTEGSRVGD